MNYSRIFPHINHPIAAKKSRLLFYAAFLLLVVIFLGLMAESSSLGRQPTPDAAPQNANSFFNKEQPMTTNFEQQAEINSKVSNGVPTASATVNGQTYQVSGNGDLHKDIQTDNTQTHLTISVQQQGDGAQSSSSSSSSVHVESNTTMEGL